MCWVRQPSTSSYYSLSHWSSGAWVRIPPRPPLSGNWTGPWSDQKHPTGRGLVLAVTKWNNHLCSTFNLISYTISIRNTYTSWITTAVLIITRDHKPRSTWLSRVWGSEYRANRKCLLLKIPRSFDHRAWTIPGFARVKPFWVCDHQESEAPSTEPTERGSRLRSIEIARSSIIGLERSLAPPGSSPSECVLRDPWFGPRPLSAPNLRSD